MAGRAVDPLRQAITVIPPRRRRRMVEDAPGRLHLHRPGDLRRGKGLLLRCGATLFGPDAKQPPPLKLSMTQAINPSDDPFMPWPSLFAEHVSHPSVWQPTNDREFLLGRKAGRRPPRHHPSPGARHALHRAGPPRSLQALDRPGEELRRHAIGNECLQFGKPADDRLPRYDDLGRTGTVALAASGIRPGSGGRPRTTRPSRCGNTTSNSRCRCRMSCSCR